MDYIRLILDEVDDEGDDDGDGDRRSELKNDLFHVYHRELGA